MFTLYMNLDKNQPKSFRNFKTLTEWMLEHKWESDGLAYFDDEICDDDATINLHYVDTNNNIENWEVEEFPEYCGTSLEYEDAVKEFVELLMIYFGYVTHNQPL
ncbi:MAG: hypothetical protein WA061_01750 [Microgenomates group bacterium]